MHRFQSWIQLHFAVEMNCDYFIINHGTFCSIQVLKPVLCDLWQNSKRFLEIKFCLSLFFVAQLLLIKVLWCKKWHVLFCVVREADVDMSYQTSNAYVTSITNFCLILQKNEYSLKTYSPTRYDIHKLTLEKLIQVHDPRLFDWLLYVYFVLLVWVSLVTMI